ncbi:MAG TPA: CheR family methyltransferase [Gemmataceae bacterium]|nr:CheR family methyltransferase [Gemmataceae bacterium]
MAESQPDTAPSIPPTEDPPGLPFPVVGVGASAGGLEAYTELLEALPARPNLALLLVSHLDPDHESHLPEILGRVSKMPVRQVSGGMKVQVDHVYVIPPGTTMALADGHLTLVPRPPRAVPHMPIDHLFRSLAGIQKARSIGVVLSGNGSDGAIALQAIKAVGGVTFAQDEKSARNPSMPRAAALDGNVDHVLRPKDIARELEKIARHAYSVTGDLIGPVPPPPPQADAITGIIDLLRARTSVDFTHYKQTTIRRRILRRMALRNLAEPKDYLAVLRADAAEIQNLYHDFLIRVTQFFRDAEAFDALKEKAFPDLVRNRPAGDQVRLWVAGCATGEEVYSLAISLLEFLDGRPESVGIKILATDLNEEALERARAGVYLDNIEIDINPERLRRFFVRHEGHYQISKAVRELCVFSRHNLTSDPPFRRLDLVSCRNVLIYMDAPLQKRVMPLFHYALNPDGVLFLGTSENVGPTGDLFEVLDARNRLFKRTASAGAALDFNAYVTPDGRPRPAWRDDGAPLWSALDVQKEADRVLLHRYAPVGVVVDETMNVLQFRGRLQVRGGPAPGMASLDLFRMLREGLLAEVRAATAQAKSDNVVVVREGLRMTEGGASGSSGSRSSRSRCRRAGSGSSWSCSRRRPRPTAPRSGRRPRSRPPRPTPRWANCSRNSAPSASTSSRSSRSRRARTRS